MVQRMTYLLPYCFIVYWAHKKIGPIIKFQYSTALFKSQLFKTTTFGLYQVNSFIVNWIFMPTDGTASPGASNTWLTHWGRVTHICVSSLTIIWIKVVISLIGPLETTLSEIFIEIYAFLFRKMHLNAVCEMSAMFSRPRCVNSLAPGRR